MKEYQEENTNQETAVRRFELMLRNNDEYYFEHDDLEQIVEHYIMENHHNKASE
jgi:hypothetical protein